MKTLPDFYLQENTRSTAIRVIKKESGIVGLPTFTFVADFACKQLTDAKHFYETESEFVLFVAHALLTDACVVTCCFETPVPIRAVVCERESLPFGLDGNRVQFSFEVSGLTGPTHTLGIHTLLHEPGLTLRIEHNHPDRRTGAYREAYPAAQIEAALHYQFAMRELLHALDLPAYVHGNALGYLLLLGFETCDPIHGDYPPHWHLIFRWPKHCGSPAPHLYLDSAGRMTHNRRCHDGLHGVSHDHPAGDWCPLMDAFGRPLCAIAVDEDGGLSVCRPGSSIWRLSPWQPGQGVRVFKEEQPLGNLQVTDDSAAGHLEVRWCSQTGPILRPSFREGIDYDPLTGKLLRDERNPG